MSGERFYSPCSILLIIHVVFHSFALFSCFQAINQDSVLFTLMYCIVHKENMIVIGITMKSIVLYNVQTMSIKLAFFGHYFETKYVLQKQFSWFEQKGLFLFFEVLE